jgi:hypothetical protein
MPMCKLCREDRELRESHFLPAAVYAQLRDAAQDNSNPVLVTSRISLTTSRQITDRVLCADCEQRFNTLGEAWVLANMFRPEGFAIQEALLATEPIGANDSFAYYSATDVPAINMNALVYFALSIFWRGSAHTWVSVAQRWQNEGMPVTREGRFVYASPEELTAWVGTEHGKKEPVHIATKGEDLVADLKQSLSYVRKLRKKNIKELGVGAPRYLRATDIRWRDAPSHRSLRASKPARRHENVGQRTGLHRLRH